MGCGGSKSDDLPLVSLCRERKELIRAAADSRYALAAAHVAYFRTLSDIGHALHRFVNEELSVLPQSSPSAPSSPVLTLPPSSKGKSSSSSSTSLSHSISQHNSPPEDSDSHLHFDSESASNHTDEDARRSDGGGPSSPYQPAANYYYMRSSTAVPSVVYEQPQPQPLDPLPSSPSNYYYMRPSTAIPSVVNEQPPQGQPHDPFYGSAGYFGFQMGSAVNDPYYNVQRSPERAPMPPPPPPPPEVSTWDFLNPFSSFENGYPGYGYGYPQGRYGSSSSISSPDSTRVREREGIPDLEDEMADQEPLPVKEVKREKKSEEDLGSGPSEGTSKAGAATVQDDGNAGLASEKESKSSPGTTSGSKSTGGEGRVRKKGVSFEMEQPAVAESIESARPSSSISLSTSHRTQDIRQGTRDIREVVKEIKDQFETAADCGKDLSVMLEAGKLRYRRRNPILEAISCRMLDAVAPPALTSSRPLTKQSKRSAANSPKMAKARDGDFEKAAGMKSGNLSSTLEKLYAWEKKLYKEVKDEEKLRLIYEKKCKQLKYLDDRGAESNKIDATQASIRKLLTKISITIKAVDAISSRIHKLRDEELQPQMTELIQGLITMWKNMVKCHQKQFQAILETKSHNLKGKTGIQRDSSMRAAMELEQELLNWCSRFNDWISTQKAYIEALNGWLLRWLLQEPEETADGIVPFSPSRVGAPSVFVICNDWYHAMERISEAEVSRAIHTFAARVHMLWEMQDEEQRQKLKAEYLSKDIEKRLKSLHKGSGMQGNRSALDGSVVLVSEKDSIVLPNDDRKMALDSMRKRLDEEREKHKEAVKRVHEVASGSLDMGFVPVFEAMENFTCETLKAHEEVRIQSSGGT
ncbi:protein ROLLING AND ERECT LEAF 2-like [Magnolia sinica]|uniref:protein ROLLING AND ERECT LEAF 2-like n=1 Tax=Magnolia sinica TaxID=86752 RepID=UPI002657E99B|nr:protein ROLLING AND ERECT LEAF 2-like [Magnolia sinica]